MDGVDLSVARGRTLGIVGESRLRQVGAVALDHAPGAAARPHRRRRASMFDGRDLLDLPTAEMRAIRGNRIAMIFQEPMTSLNPVFTVGDQITEAMRAHDRSVISSAASRPARSTRWPACASPRRRGGSTSIRTRCPAACASG